MACKGCTCGSSSKAGESDKVSGCNSNGCSSGGCNRMNTFDWLTALDIDDTGGFDTVEISFKNGSRKEFFKNPPSSRATTGDMVLVEADNNGYDVGRISLSGDLVRIQMKKRNVKENTILGNVIRKANERDLERLQESREAEKPSMIQARAIARSLNLDMKIGDVEYQGDKRKATFFYTADGRVDFRELIREFAREFKVKIEMRQIGARQESARVGGLGPCGRELCCSTWLTDFKSVSTTAARYQNLAINQSKLSGQCGRLKCCLNYELDTYMDALEHFPTKADRIYTEEGSAVLVKTDIFKGLMFYCYEKDHGRGKFYPLEIEQVKDVLVMNKAGQKPTDLLSLQTIEEEEEEVGFDGDLTGVVELPTDRKKKKKKKKKPELKKDDRRDRPKGDSAPKTEQNYPLSTDTKGDAPRNNNNKGDNRPPRNNEKRNENRPPREPRDNQNNPNKPQEPREQKPNNEKRPDNRPPREPRDNQNNPNKPQEPREQKPNNEKRNENRPPREPKDNQNNPNKPQEPREQKPNNEKRNENRPPREPRDNQNNPNKPQEPREQKPNNEKRNENRPPREPRDNQNNPNKPQEPREQKPNNEKRNENRPPREPRDNQDNPNKPQEPREQKPNNEKRNENRPPQPPKSENAVVENKEIANNNLPSQNPQENGDAKPKNFKHNKWKNKKKGSGDRKPDNKE